MEPARLFAGGGLSSKGPFAVEVSAPQYEVWSASGVWLRERARLPDVSPVLRVWLTPSDGRVREPGAR